MAAGTTPKQGDHVFNAVDDAIMHPYDTVASLRSELVDGQQFIHEYLLHSYSFAHDLSRNPLWSSARRYVSMPGAEQETLRELKNLSSRNPALARITPVLLRNIHNRNSDRFGAAAAEFEMEVLRVIREALEKAVALAGAPRDVRPTRGPGLAFQHMLDTSYDPAAALSVITRSMTTEQPGIQSNFHPVIFGIAETLDRPGMWKEPYLGFREMRSTGTGEAVKDIGSLLLRLDGMKAQSLLLAKWIADEIEQKKRTAGAEAVYGSMLHLLHARLEKIGYVR